MPQILWSSVNCAAVDRSFFVLDFIGAKLWSQLLKKILLGRKFISLCFCLSLMWISVCFTWACSFIFLGCEFSSLPSDCLWNIVCTSVTSVAMSLVCSITSVLGVKWFTCSYMVLLKSCHSSETYHSQKLLEVYTYFFSYISWFYNPIPDFLDFLDFYGDAMWENHKRLTKYLTALGNCETN